MREVEAKPEPPWDFMVVVEGGRERALIMEESIDDGMMDL